MSVLLLLALGAAPPTDQGVPAGAKLYALLVGVDEYSNAPVREGVSDVRTSASSARELARTLTRFEAGYAAVDVRFLLNREVTRARILSELKRLAQTVETMDR